MSDPADRPIGDRSGTTASTRISSEVMMAAVIFLFMAVLFVILLYLYAKFYLRPGPVLRGRSGRARLVFAAADFGLPLARGLDAAVLRSLPVTVYRAAEFEEGLECAVCLSELADGEKARLLPKCGHGFHLECIDMWFHSHSTCPLCRSPVSAEPSVNPEPSAEAVETSPPATVPEPPVLPTNVLFLGSQDQVSARNLATGSPEGPSSSSGRSSKPEGGLVIEIPRRGLEGFPSPISPLPTSRLPVQETTRSPVSARFRSLRRLWTSCSPREGDIEQGLGGCGEGRAPPPKSPINL